MSQKHKLQLEIVCLHHDTPIRGHGGQWKTMELVMWNYWWPSITKFIKTYIRGCDKCQWNKSQAQPPAGKLMMNSAPEWPWTHISVDFVVKLPEAQGYDMRNFSPFQFPFQRHLYSFTYIISRPGDKIPLSYLILSRKLLKPYHGISQYLIFGPSTILFIPLTCFMTPGLCKAVHPIYQ